MNNPNLIFINSYVHKNNNNSIFNNNNSYGNTNNSNSNNSNTFHGQKKIQSMHILAQIQTLTQKQIYQNKNYLQHY